MDKVRCPSCRGAKKVAKLGGIIGECNTCEGVGKIKAADKVAIVIPVAVNELRSIKDAVNTAIPWKSDKPDFSKAPDDVKIIYDIVDMTTPATKVDPKKALYRRKVAK